MQPVEQLEEKKFRRKFPSLPQVVNRERWSTESTGSFLVSLGIVLLLYGVLSGKVAWWSINGPVLLPSGIYGLFAGAVVALVGIGMLRLRVSRVQLLPEAFACGIIGVFFSDWLCRGYGFFEGPYVRGELFVGFCVMWVTLTNRIRWIWYLAMPLVIGLLFSTFFDEANGRLLFSDDHATFLYRLTVLKENFPSIPFYGPLWNGGIDERDFFATGTLNLFLLTAPLLYSFDIPEIYNFIVSGLLFFGVPFAMFLAGRVGGFSLRSTFIAALLSLSTSALWYRWGLSYGTLGFVTSVALLPLVLALGIRIVALDKDIRWWHALLYVCCFTLAVLWSPAGIVCVPLIAVGISRLGKLWKKRYVALICTALICINIPWMALFWSASSVSSFLVADKSAPKAEQSDSQQHSLIGNNEDRASSVQEKRKRTFKHRPGQISLKKSLSALQSVSNAFNPVLVFMGLVGIVCLRGSTRLVFGLTAFWLFTLGAVLFPLKPQLELDRMLVVLGAILCLPAARAVECLVVKAMRTASGVAPKVLASSVGAFVLIGPFVSASIVGNRTLQQYSFAEPYVQELGQMAKIHSEGGRILFSGSVIHEFSGGHLAPLAHFTKAPLIASSQVHNLWRYKQVFPSEYIGERMPGIERYLSLYNVSVVFAHERDWKKRFRAHPDIFSEVWSGGRFTLFKVRGFRSNYFLEGAGAVNEQTSNSVAFTLEQPNAVLKFNYLPFVQVPGCRVSPFEVSESVTFLRLEDCPVGKVLRLKSMSPWDRFYQQELK